MFLLLSKRVDDVQREKIIMSAIGGIVPAI